MVLKEPVKEAISTSEGAATSRWVEPADGWLAAGILSCGTMLLGPFGAIVLAVGLVKLWRSVKAGTNVRPWPATVIGAFCMIDGMINFLPWSLDTFAHNSILGRTFITGYGRFFDGAFFVDYNKGALGGVANHSEKMWWIHTVSATSMDLGGCRAEWISAFTFSALEVVRRGMSRRATGASGAGHGRVDDQGEQVVA